MNVEKFDYSELCKKMAAMTIGMSGREIAKLGVAWQAAGYTSEDGLLTKDMVMSRCEDAIKQHTQKVFFKAFDYKWNSAIIFILLFLDGMDE